METHLTIEYDQGGDILYLGMTAPYPEQDTEELDYGIIARLNPETGEVESLELLFFNQRLAKGETLQLPILAQFQIPRAAA